MRKLILVFAVIAISAGAYAQTDSTNKKMSPPDINKTDDNLNQNRDLNKTDDGLNQNRDLNQNQDLNKIDDNWNQNRDLNNNQNQNWQNNPDDNAYPDGIVMQNGIMMKVKNGKLTILDDDMTMSNGTKISSDGIYIEKDGTKVTMKEGQHIDMSGTMTPSKSKKDKNMYLVPDSTVRKNY